MEDANLYVSERAWSCRWTELASQATCPVPCLEQRSDPVRSGWIFPCNQECSRIASWWLRHLPTRVPPRHLEWTNMTPPLVTNIMWKIMHKINTKIWSLAWTYCHPQTYGYYSLFIYGKSKFFFSWTFEIPLQFLSVTTRTMPLFMDGCRWWQL